MEIPGQQPTHFTVGVQTDYRESETQTDPYSPGYVIRRGATASELLQLAALSWGRRQKTKTIREMAVVLNNPLTVFV